MKEDSFKINVNEQEYTVTPIHIEIETPGKKTHKERFRIETGCEYLFTIEMTEEWYWRITDDDVKPIDQNIVQEIGEAIEKISS